MSLPFNPTAGLIIIPVRLWGPTADTIVELALDTGATSTVVSREVAALIGYDPSPEAERVQMTTGSGLESVSRLTLEKIEALGYEHRQFPVICHTLPTSAGVDGLLGLDFLRGRHLMVDFRRGLLILA